MNNKKGISLIVLVITILVMIILAGVVIVSLQNDNPINKAKFAKMVDSVQSIRSAISQYAVTAQANSTDNETYAIDNLLTLTADGSTHVALGKASKTGYLITSTTYTDSNSKTIKQLLGVDPSQLKTYGNFVVDRKTGASEFILNSDAQKMAEGNTLPDGIVKTRTMPEPTANN